MIETNQALNKKMKARILLSYQGLVYLPNYRVPMSGTAICWFVNTTNSVEEGVSRDFPFVGEFQIERLDPHQLIYLVRLQEDLQRTIKDGLLCLDANSYDLLVHVAEVRNAVPGDDRRVIDWLFARKFPYLPELCQYFPRELSLLRQIFATGAPI
jgi:hypothetical protein